MSKQIFAFRCPYCRLDEAIWSFDLEAVEAMSTAAGPAKACFNVANMDAQAVIQFGGTAAHPRRSPCRHAVSLCIDADLRTDHGAGVPPNTVASVAVTWDHPALIACDPIRDLQYHLWEEYDYDDKDEAQDGADGGGAAWKPRLVTPYLISSVTAAPRRVGPRCHLYVSGTVMVAADPVAFVGGLAAGYHQLRRLEEGVGNDDVLPDFPDSIRIPHAAANQRSAD